MNARLVFDLTVSYQDPSVILPQYAAISLAGEVEGVRPPVTVCSDSAVDLGGGLLRRTVKLAYSADFIAAYPTLSDKMGVLAGFGTGVLNARLPGRVVFNSALSDYEAVDCPP